MRTAPRLASLSLLLLIFIALPAAAQKARARIAAPIDDRNLVALPGNTHPLARPEFDAGTAPADLPANRMILLLSRAPEQQAALEKFLADQQDPGSANYLHWLTPAEFGDKFGPADGDVATVTNWLRSQGFVVERVTAGKNAIEFSGTAALVQRAFHTALHQYVVNAQEYWANAQDPQIPAALTPVVRGIVSLNNFPRKPLSHRLGAFSRQPDGTVKPQFTVSNSSGTYYALGPADFATIYNTNSLLQAGNNGAGQTVAILGRSNVHLSDVATFRNFFGLGAGNTSVVIDGPDPGIVPGDEDESVLDLEWASAVAPSASVVLVSAEGTATTSGLELAALHVIDKNLAGIMSLSYGICESALGAAGNQYIQSLWQQAAAQGITVIVSAGDSGSAGCDYQAIGQIADSGIAVNGLASTAYNVAIGGTDFDDAGSQSTYWNSTNNSTTHGSALSYIPETAWNSTCAATASAGNLNVCPQMPASGSPSSSSGLNILAGAAGASSCAVSTSSGGAVQCQAGNPKPSWQIATGVPADSVRDLPDVSLFSAVRSNSHSFYVVCQSDLPGMTYACTSTTNLTFAGVGGTSVAAASFAGIVALAQQKAGTRLGNINYLLYSLASQSGASCASTASPASSCIFNDVVSGNISVPCKAGSPNCSQTSGAATGVMVDGSASPAFMAGAGYDLATGLGSVNVTNLVSGIANAIKNAAPTTTSLTLNGSTAAITAQHGAAISVAVGVSPTSSTGTVSLMGKTGGMGSAALNSGAAAWNSHLFPGGSYAVTAHYPGDATHVASDSNSINVTINPEPSQTFVNFITFGSNHSFTAASVDYGAPYILRADVTDAAGTVSSATGVNSTCSTGTASCPTGALTITANGSPLDLGTYPLNSQGFAEDHPIQLPAGTYSVVASYPGDASYNASTGSATLTVNKAQTTLTANTPVVGTFQYGSQGQINASLSTKSSGGAPTGTYTFTDNGSPAGNSVKQSFQDARAASGPSYASVTYYGWYIPPSVGTHTLYAQYSGDANYLPSDSSAAPFTVTVVKANTTINGGLSSYVALPTTKVTLTANVQTSSQLAQPTGTVTFYDNGTPINGTVVYGPEPGYYSAAVQATLTTTFPVATHTITATYSGDSNYGAAASQPVGTLKVYDKLPSNVAVNAELNPTVVNYSTKLTATISATNFPGAPAMTGTVTFADNGQPLSGTVAYSSFTYNTGNLTATLPYAFTATGTHNITATYSGDSTYATATSPVVALNVVSKLSTSINFNPNGGVVNQPVFLSVGVNTSNIYAGPVMGGTVTFLDGGVPLAGNVTYETYQGYLIARMTYTFTTAGTHNLTAQYSGDTNYASATSNVAAWNILGPLAVLLQGNNLTAPSTGGSGNVSVVVFNSTANAMAVTVTCTPDSSSASCSLNPNSFNVPAGSTVAPNLTYTVPRLGSGLRRHGPFTIPIVFAAALVGLPLLTRKQRTFLLTFVLAGFLIALVSCGGGGGSSSGGATTGTGNASPKVYKFTVTATSGSNTDSQVLTVTVQ